MTKLSEAQDAFFAAFAEMPEANRSHFLNDLEMMEHSSFPDDSAECGKGHKTRFYVVLNALDALSQAISEEQ